MPPIDYFLNAKLQQLKDELKEAKAVTELCYAMLMGSVLLNVVLAWLVLND